MRRGPGVRVGGGDSGPEAWAGQGEMTGRSMRWTEEGRA